MRKFFSLLAAVLFAGSMMATEVVFTNADFAGQGTANTGSEVTATKDGVTFTFSKGYSATESLRCYAHGALTISAESTIEKINFTTTGGKTGGLEAEVTVGATTYSVADLASQARFTEIKVTLGGEAPSVATPVISGEAEFTESTQVSISCTTEGAAIYYTLDGADPTTNSLPYGEPFTLNESATVKAVAYDSENSQYSAVATKTFTKKEPLVAISCAEVYNKAKGDELALNNVVVAYANGKNVYVQDETGSMLLYLTQSTTWEAGNILSGVEGTLDIYNDLYEVKMTDAQATAVQPGQGEAPAPIEFTAAPVDDDMNKYILLKNVKVDTTAFPSNKNMNATIGGETFVLRNNFNANVAFDTTKLYDITGVVSVYKGAVQVYFISAEEAVAPVHTYTVAGNLADLFGAAWDPAVIENDLQPIVGGEYTHAWGKESVLLEAGNVLFKVCEDHGWEVAYPAQNYELPIAEKAIYNVSIFFNAETKAVYAEAQKVGDAPVVGGETIYDWAGNIGTTIFGGNSNITTGTVKIHENIDDVNGIKFGSSYVYEEGKYIAIKPAEGGFKAGDEISLSVVFNNSDLTKYCMADVYAADKTTRLFRSDSASTLNGRNAGEQIVQTYTLASDQDSLLLGRYGNTGMFITLLKVTRALVPPTPEDTWTVAGEPTTAFGSSWTPSDANNDMVKQEDGTYKWERTGLELGAGTVKFKVCKNHDWTESYPAQNYELTIDEAGIYTITITFDPANDNAVNAVATKTGEAVVVPTVVMHGQFASNDWADTEAFAKSEDKKTATLKLTLEAKTIEFGMKFDGSWKANGANITREAASTSLAEGSGNMHLVADVAGEYTFTYTYETQVLAVTYPDAPVVADTIVIDIEKEVQYTDYVAQAGWWQFMAENDEYSISISNVSTTQAAGTYTVADLDADYSYILRLADSLSIAFVEGSFELTEGEDGSRTIEGVVTGDDEKIYSIKLVFRIPTAETTVNVEIPEWGVVDAAQIYSYTGTLFYGEAADGTYIQFVVLGNNPIGTFTYDDMLPAGTGIEVGGKYKAIYSMDVTVNVSDAQRAIITMDILCLNNTLYHVTTHIGQGINAVEAAQKAVKMIQNGQVVIIKNGVHYNINGAVIR